MTASAIIEEIRRLPPLEQIDVIEFTCKLAAEKQAQVRVVDDVELQRAVDRIFVQYPDLMRKLAS